jgi:peptide/nickel transport system substrate-binding protein
MRNRPVVSAALFVILVSCTKVGGLGWGTHPLFGYIQRQIDLGQLYCETLVGLDNRNRLVPLLASQVPSQANGGIARDGATITYHLRRGVRFADGVELTSRT